MDRKIEMLEHKLMGVSTRLIGEIFGISHQAVDDRLGLPPAIVNTLLRRQNRRCYTCGIIIGERSPKFVWKGNQIIIGKYRLKGEELNYDELELLCMNCSRTKYNERKGD